MAYKSQAEELKEAHEQLLRQALAQPGVATAMQVYGIANGLMQAYSTATMLLAPQAPVRAATGTAQAGN